MDTRQTMKTQMKCRMMWHFIRVCTVCLDKIDLQRKKYHILGGGGIITCDPLIYTMDHPNLTLSSFIEYSFGLKRVKGMHYEIFPSHRIANLMCKNCKFGKFSGTFNFREYDFKKR